MHLQIAAARGHELARLRPEEAFPAEEVIEAADGGGIVEGGADAGGLFTGGAEVLAACLQVRKMFVEIGEHGGIA